MHQEGRQKKPMYILSLDNSRVVWLMSIATLVFVFLFLLGYWIGKDTGNAAAESTVLHQSGFQNDLLALKGELQQGGVAAYTPWGSDESAPAGMPGGSAQPMGIESAPSRASLSSPATAPGSRALKADDFATPDEQREFESLVQSSAAPVRASAPAAAPAPAVSAPAPSPLKSSAAENSPAASGSGAYAVQVASLGSQSTADRLASDLRTQGFTVYVSPANVNGTQYYRVKVGNFSTHTAAKEQMDKLRAMDAGRESFVVQN